jgi:hypothetical protein
MTTPDVPEPRQGGTLDAWMAALAEALGLPERTFDVAGLLDAARDVAHGVARPAAPVSLYLVGLAVGRAGGSADDFAGASDRMTALAATWAAAGGDA